jgi:CDP-diacylglycerol--glycerol-3-phosphate 3-phosphatidyltransferase
MNLANRITVVRILLVPVMMVVLLVNVDVPELRLGDFAITWNQLLGTVIFVVAALSDGIDGYIARSRKMVTRLGTLLDPLADKLLIATVLIALVDIGKLDAWVAICIISREFAVTGLRQVALLEGRVLAASAWGKWKTMTQITMIIALLLNNFPFHYVHIPFDVVVCNLAVVITLISGFDYFHRNRALIESLRVEEKG